MTLERPALRAAASVPSFDELYGTWFREVMRWMPGFGVPRSELEDVAQEAFLVARRLLPGFDGENVAGWLYAITLRVARNQMRLAWFRRVLLRDDRSGADVIATAATPERAAVDNQLLVLADGVLAKMSDKHRRAFVLFEIQGYSGEEIAALEGIPVATVWTRIHHARADFTKRAAKVRATIEGSR